MPTTIKFRCPHEDCGEWIITTLDKICSLQGFYCSFCKKQIPPWKVFGGMFGTGELDYEKEFLAYIGSHIVDIDDLAQTYSQQVREGQLSAVKAQATMLKEVEKVFQLVKIFKGYHYEGAGWKAHADSHSNGEAYRVSCYCGGA